MKFITEATSSDESYLEDNEVDLYYDNYNYHYYVRAKWIADDIYDFLDDDDYSEESGLYGDELFYYIIENFDDLVVKYYDRLLDLYRDSAFEHACVDGKINKNYY